MRTYLTVFYCASGLAIGGVAALNYIVDPHLTHQWDSPRVQQLRPAREKLSAWGKTYALARYRPQVLYLGNSRTELALPAGVPAFAGQTVFNGALSGASLGDAAAMALHARRVGRPATVVWGVDAPSFSLAVGADFDRELVAGGGHFFAHRGLINLKRALTLDMTQDSLSVLAGSFGAVCKSSLALYGQRDERCINDHMQHWGGTSAAVAPRLREFIRGEGPTADALEAFGVAVRQMCGDGTRVRLYINPTHASMLDALYRRGKGGAHERWQQALARMAQTRRREGCDTRLFDFSGFNSITTEPLARSRAGPQMVHYWEPSHYRANVGRMVIARIFGGAGDAAPADFGVELRPEMMKAHLANQLEGVARYRRQHARDAELVRLLAAEEARAKARGI
ncbi:hypothetical protein [Massilia glaciei]|uniref:Uncharacterized protein n=1 Tax=Massilia glaciei TaxID=1524097 RepID=A0A2U2HJF2_9BURK|nr:hypothetical protein [Massilia glaciei]PWF47649.1 hypothetical protein C7C56_014380 [Massilia glaciei]